MIDLKQNLLSDLRSAGFGLIATELVDLSKECFRLRSTPASKEPTSVGSSKLGGLPDLPRDLSWPQWKTGHLAFVGQLNLAEIPPNNHLPSVGLLSFFYDQKQSAWGFDPNHKDGFRLWYFPEVSKLHPASELEAEPEPCTFPCARLSFEASLSLPDPSANRIKGLLLELDDDDKYVAFFEKFRAAPQHQLLGWPHVIQDEMELECQLVTNGLYAGDTSAYKDPRRKPLEAGVVDWTLLLQIDSDDNAAMMWGDGGMLYSWIRREDLALRNFDKSGTILQCF